jgi:hypothetical protein
MALTIAQYEEILAILREVSILVDKLEARNASLFDDVLGWLKHAEQTLTNNRLPAASQIAIYRARLIEAGRGVQQEGLTIAGRPSVSKIKEATAALVLGHSNGVLQALIAERQPALQEAERVARQLLALAQVKGVAVAPRDGAPQQQFLHQLQDQLKADPELATVYAHIVGLVGATDALVVLDRALASVD